jgi:DNA repair exonuclease SbcCD ATPase subunit
VETKAVLASAVDNLSTVQAEGTKLDHKIDAASVEQVRIKDLVERYIVDRSNIQANLNQLSEAWSKLKDLNAACPCPVCKSMITDVAGLKASTSALMAAAQASYDKLSGEISKATNDERIKGKELSELTVQRQTNLVQQGISKKQKQEAEAWLSGYAGVESVEALSNRLVQAQKAAALTPEVALLNSRLEGYKSKEALLLKTLQEYSDLPEVIASLDSDRMAAVRSWLKDSDNVLSQISALKGSRSTFQVQLDELDKTLVGLTPPTLELTKATEDVVIALQTVWETAKEAVGRLDMLKATIQGLKIKIAQLEDQRGQCGKVTELIQRFEKIREVLERRNFPLTFVQQYFVRLMPRIQHHLAASGADFVVRQSAEDPVSFVFDKLDGSCLGLTVDKLSGGQKVRLVVAFLFALHEYMSAKMGFLVLDEPTVFLDDTGVESFGELLSDIVVRLKNSDMQVLISTHEQGLKSQFTSSIQLGNAV